MRNVCEEEEGVEVRAEGEDDVLLLLSLLSFPSLLSLLLIGEDGDEGDAASLEDEREGEDVSEEEDGVRSLAL